MMPYRRRHLLLALCATLLACVLMTVAAPSTHAATADPVIRAINVALMKKQITPADAARHRSTWWSAGSAARRSSTWARRNEVAAVRTYTTRLARSGGLTARRLEPVLLSVRATTWVMRNGSFPRHEQKITIPGEIVVFKYYAGRGVQFQAFETFKLGMASVNLAVTPDAEDARRIADRMLQLGVWRGNSLVWEYYFPFGGPAAPWTSSISQALGTEFFQRVAAVSPDGQGTRYANVATAMSRSFLRSSSSGGVSVKEGDGRWYLIYPFAPSQRILNGHLQVLVNLTRYAEAANSDSARLVVDEGIRGVVPLLPRFDTGAWSNYLPGQEADLEYHDFQTSQLRRLADITGNTAFRTYADRFATYRVTPPTLAIPGRGWPAIVPARDGFRDSIVVAYRADKRSRDTLRIVDANGLPVRTLTATGGRGVHRIVWDGRDSAGRLVLDGAYTGSITAVDVVGNSRTFQLPAPLTMQRDRQAPSLLSHAVRSAGATSTVVETRVADAGSAWVTVRVVLAGRAIAVRRGPRVGRVTLRIPRPVGTVRRAVLELTDSSGNRLLQPLG